MDLVCVCLCVCVLGGRGEEMGPITVCVSMIGYYTENATTSGSIKCYYIKTMYPSQAATAKPTKLVNLLRRNL